MKQYYPDSEKTKDYVHARIVNDPVHEFREIKIEKKIKIDDHHHHHNNKEKDKEKDHHRSSHRSDHHDSSKKRHHDYHHKSSSNHHHSSSSNSHKKDDSSTRKDKDRKEKSRHNGESKHKHSSSQNHHRSSHKSSKISHNNNCDQSTNIKSTQSIKPLDTNGFTKSTKDVTTTIPIPVLQKIPTLPDTVVIQKKVENNLEKKSDLVPVPIEKKIDPPVQKIEVKKTHLPTKLKVVNSNINILDTILNSMNNSNTKM